MEDVREIEVVDIPIDFKRNVCKICGKEIKNDEPMYYCYKCKSRDKYCSDCVMKHYLNKENKGIKNSQIENIIYYFSKREIRKALKPLINSNQEMTFSKMKKTKINLKITKDFVTDAKRKFIDSPRYICINCNKGSLIYGRYHEYCWTCIDHMMKGDEAGKKTPRT